MTGGDARGIALRDHYVFLADGRGGLKIFNMSNPEVVMLTGRLVLPESFVDQVALDGDMVVLTDTRNKRIHLVDVWDVMRPRLGKTHSLQDLPRAVAGAGGKAFVVVRGEPPSHTDYFSGIEVFSYGTKRETTQQVAIEDVRDLALRGAYVFVAAGNRLLVYQQSPTGIDSRPVDQVEFPETETIQSLALYQSYLFALGNEQLYVVGPVALNSLTPLIPRPLLPHKIKAQPRELRIYARAAVPGDLENRKVDAAVLDLGGGHTTEPYIAVLLTTRKGYGGFLFDKTTHTLTPYEMSDLRTLSSFTFRDVYELSEGRLVIYDSAFPDDFYPGFAQGGLMGVGAIGNMGLGYVYGRPSRIGVIDLIGWK